MASGRGGGKSADEQVTQQLLEAAWHETAARAGLAGPNAEAAFVDLCRRYSEPGRAYHSLDHIAAMLSTISEFGGNLHGDGAVRLAVWFHDAVYDSRRGDNEAQSAAYVAEVLNHGGASSRLVPTVERLILATKTHQALPGDTDCQILLDADLAILGSSAAEYGRYAQANRAEYAWVPEQDYRVGRRRVLESFLGRARIYYTDALFERREQAARANLLREIEWLTNPQNP